MISGVVTLLVFASAYPSTSRLSIAMHDFKTETACQAAGAAFVEIGKEQGMRVTWRCVSKG